MIDYIRFNLKSGDLLTEIVNEFVMKVLPTKDYEEFEKAAEDFVGKVADYQQTKTKMVDKAISDYVIITKGIFSSKHEIEAALAESSDDEDENL